MIERKRIKVVQIVRIPVGGIRKHILAITGGLPSEEFEHFFISDLSQGDATYESEKNVEDDHCFSLPIPNAPGPKDLFILWKCYKILKMIKPDIVHGHGAKGGLYARLLGHLVGAKVVYTAHGGALHSMHGGNKNLLYQAVEKFLYPFTDRLFFESGYTRDTYERKVHDATSKGVLIYNGTKLPEKIRTEEYSSTQKVGAFGLLRNIKGHDLLIRAIALLKEKDCNVKLLIVGDGEEKRNLKLLANQLGISDQVEIRPYYYPIDDLIRECDVVVQPSRFESFGYVPIEAMALNVPVIATKVGGLVEVIEDGVSGILVSPESPEEIASALFSILIDSDLYERMREGGMRRVKEMFSEEVMVNSIKEQYELLTATTHK